MGVRNLPLLAALEAVSMRGSEADARAARSGRFLTTMVEHAQAVFARFCEWNSFIVARACAERASIRGTGRKPRPAYAHRVFDRSCAANSGIGAMDFAAIACSIGPSAK